MKEFFDRFPATLELSIVSMFFATGIGVFVGILSAVKRYSVFDYLGMFGALAGVSMPVFWLGLLLIYMFSINLDLLPVSSRLSVHYYIEDVTGLYLVDSLLAGDFEAFGDAVRHLILPSIALSTIPMAIIARMTRSSMLEVMREDYVRTAKAKGCPPLHVILVHGLRNALIPVVTVMGLSMGALLAGAVLTETTFSWPGIGKWLVDAVYRRDFPVIQCATIIIAAMFIMLNLAVDLIYAIINPKIRLQ